MAEGRGVEKVSYSHQDMIDYILANPRVSQGELAQRYGYTQSWVSQVMQSDAWQSAFAARRDAIVDPTLTATVEERFRGITHLSLVKLQERLERPACPDNVILKAVELGAKAMGLGGNMSQQSIAPPVDHLAQLANRLLDLQSQVTQGAIINGQAQVVSE
jgi:hypothetical protein